MGNIQPSHAEAALGRQRASQVVEGTDESPGAAGVGFGLADGVRATANAGGLRAPRAERSPGTAYPPPRPTPPPRKFERRPISPTIEPLRFTSEGLFGSERSARQKWALRRRRGGMWRSARQKWALRRRRGGMWRSARQKWALRRRRGSVVVGSAPRTSAGGTCAARTNRDCAAAGVSPGLLRTPPLAAGERTNSRCPFRRGLALSGCARPVERVDTPAGRSEASLLGAIRVPCHSGTEMSSKPAMHEPSTSSTITFTS